MAGGRSPRRRAGAASSSRTQARYRRRRMAVAAVLLAAAVCLGILVNRGWNYVMEKRYPLEYGELVHQNAQEHNLEEALIYGVIRTESSFRQDAVSRAGAMGLMQLTPDTYDFVRMKSGYEAADDALLEPEVNIYCGSWLLRYLLDKYDQNLPVALAAYNAGMGNVAKWLADPACSPNGKDLEKIPFPETEAYVQKVQQDREYYEKHYFQ